MVERSNIRVFGCDIVSDVPLIRSNAESSIILSTIRVSSILPSSLIHSNSDIITLEGSSFNDLVVPGGGTFVSSGIAQKQRVIDCSFTNISRGAIREGWGISEEGILMDTVMKRCEDTFYGFIVSGPTVMTLNEFISGNSSFVECVRKHDPPKRLPVSLQRRLSSAGTCTGTNLEDCTTSDRIAGSPGTNTVTFTNAQFLNCYSTDSDGGGGLYVYNSSSTRGTISLVSCLFEGCTTTATGNLVGGGAVMVDYLKISVTSTNFTSCSSGYYGGAFCWDYGGKSIPTDYPFFKSCTFCENSATYGADLCFRPWSSDYNPFDENCITYNSAENITGYLYKRGQGPSASWTYTNQQWITRGGSVCPQPPVDDVDGIIKYPHLTHLHKTSPLEVQLSIRSSSTVMILSIVLV